MATNVDSCRITLLADGPSDRCLLRVLRWLVSEIAQPRVLESTFADLRIFRSPVRTLEERIGCALQYYPCDILFIHRDAEREPWTKRAGEIGDAMQVLSTKQRWVPVIPVRMTEAWLLIDESAIRLAADNPHGSQPLELPRSSELESVADPKAVLRRALEVACEKQGRRLDQFRRDLSSRTQRVADLIEDFSLLRSLTAFCALEAATRDALMSRERGRPTEGAG